MPTDAPMTHPDTLDERGLEAAAKALSGEDADGWTRLLAELPETADSYRAEAEDAIRAYLSTAPSGVRVDHIDHMAHRFLQWKLPEAFNPDGGISFEREYNQNTPWPMKHEPVGTNLFTFEQARDMVRHMTEGISALSSAPASDGQVHSSDCAVHNEPAYPAGPCDCSGTDRDDRSRDTTLPPESKADAISGTIAPVAAEAALAKRPTAFLYESAPGELLLTTNEDFARTLADAHGGDYRGLYLRDGSAHPSPPDAMREALTKAWTDFLDANPDDLTSPDDLPDHALMTGQQFVDYAMAALSEPRS